MADNMKCPSAANFIFRGETLGAYSRIDWVIIIDPLTQSICANFQLPFSAGYFKQCAPGMKLLWCGNVNGLDRSDDCFLKSKYAST